MASFKMMKSALPLGLFRRLITATEIRIVNQNSQLRAFAHSKSCHLDSKPNIPVSYENGSLKSRLSNEFQQDRKYCQGSRQLEVSFDELHALSASGDIQLIDVREPKELEEYGQIPGAVNIPLGQLHDALQLSESKFEIQFGVQKPQEEDNIVFSCLGGVRSYKALLQAENLGFTKARHYKGGWEDYSQRTGQPLMKMAKN